MCGGGVTDSRKYLVYGNPAVTKSGAFPVNTCKGVLIPVAQLEKVSKEALSQKIEGFIPKGETAPVVVGDFVTWNYHIHSKEAELHEERAEKIEASPMWFVYRVMALFKNRSAKVLQAVLCWYYPPISARFAVTAAEHVVPWKPTGTCFLSDVLVICSGWVATDVLTVTELKNINFLTHDIREIRIEKGREDLVLMQNDLNILLSTKHFKIADVVKYIVNKRKMPKASIYQSLAFTEEAQKLIRGKFELVTD